MVKTENENKIKCKIEPLEVAGHWFRVIRHSTCPRVFFLALGRMMTEPDPDTLSGFPR